MALTTAYVQTLGQLPEFFSAISQGQAPEQFTVQHLKDLGFTSSNHRPFIPLLKALGFLTADGTPTQRYHEYRDESRARQVLGEAMREAYGDLFVIRAKPTETDKPLIEGKFKSAHNTTERMARLMANTFFALLELSDVSPVSSVPRVGPQVEDTTLEQGPVMTNPTKTGEQERTAIHHPRTALHYNIQIHLPATKDIEVYNAIFKSLREHLVD
jgi:hypothetical protein